MYLIIAYVQFGGLLYYGLLYASPLCGGLSTERVGVAMSMVLLGHSVQFGFGYKLGQKMFLRWLPMNWAYRNFEVCIIWVFVIPGFFQNCLESLWLILSFTT